MHPLASLREDLLDMPDPAPVLRIADSYLTSMDRLGDSFVLPAEHHLVKPILEYYAGDLPGWVKYVRGVRDRMPLGTGKNNVHEFFRTIVTRQVQRERRERVNSAVEKALRLGLIEDTPDVKARYARRCDARWKLRRLGLLDALRRKTAKGRVSEAERAEALDAFWNEVDHEISRGELPEP